LEDAGAFYEWVHMPISYTVVGVAFAGVVFFVMIRVQNQASLLQCFCYLWWVLFVGPAVELISKNPTCGSTKEEAGPEQLVGWVEDQASDDQWHAGNAGVSICFYKIMTTDALRICVVVSEWLDESWPQNWKIFRAIAIKGPMDGSAKKVREEERNDGGRSDCPHGTGLDKFWNN